MHKSAEKSVTLVFDEDNKHWDWARLITEEEPAEITQINDPLPTGGWFGGGRALSTRTEHTRQTTTRKTNDNDDNDDESDDDARETTWSRTTGTRKTKHTSRTTTKGTPRQRSKTTTRTPRSTGRTTDKTQNNDGAKRRRGRNDGHTDTHDDHDDAPGDDDDCVTVWTKANKSAKKKPKHNDESGTPTTTWTKTQKGETGSRHPKTDHWDAANHRYETPGRDTTRTQDTDDRSDPEHVPQDDDDDADQHEHVKNNEKAYAFAGTGYWKCPRCIFAIAQKKPWTAKTRKRCASSKARHIFSAHGAAGQ